MKRKIAIISSHPIQYNAPLFALMAKELKNVMVFYTWGEKSLGAKYDPDFCKNIEWDIPLLEGYDYKFVENTSKNPGSHHFRGIINPTLISEIENWGAEIIWVWGWSFVSHLKVIRHFKGKIPIWFRGDSTLLNESSGFSMKKIARRILLSWIYSHVDIAFYVGTHNKNYFLKHWMKESQLVFAPHAVDNYRFSDINSKKSLDSIDMRKNLGIKNSDILVLFAGKLEPRKNPFFLIKMMNSIKKNNVKLLIVGNGPLEKKMKEDSSADKRIQFLDFQNQRIMPTIYRMANIFILPSVSETWGLSLNEALASGNIVIASQNCGGAIDLINESNGLIFNPEKDLQDVAYFIENIKLGIINKVNKTESIVHKYSYHQIIKAIKSVINT